MARGAGTVPAARVIEADAVVQSNIQQRLFLAVVFVRQLAVIKFHGFAFGQKRDLHRVFSWSIRGCRACAVCLFFSHSYSCAAGVRLGYSKSAFATGCGASRSSPRSASSMVLPFRAVLTAVSIMSSASRI